MRRGSNRAIHHPTRQRMTSATARGCRVRSPWRTTAAAGRRRVEQWPTGCGCERAQANWIPRQSRNTIPVSTCVPEPCSHPSPWFRLSRPTRPQSDAPCSGHTRRRPLTHDARMAHRLSLPAHDPVRASPLAAPSLPRSASALCCSVCQPNFLGLLSAKLQRAQSSRGREGNKQRGREREESVGTGCCLCAAALGCIVLPPFCRLAALRCSAAATNREAARAQPRRRQRRARQTAS